MTISLVSDVTAVYIKQQVLVWVELRAVFVVGGGTSGGVIASRLAEDRDMTVLLIEAGGNPESEPDIDVPLFADKVRGSTEWDWNFVTTPQKHACKSHEGKVSQREKTRPFRDL